MVEQARALHDEQLKGGTDGARGLDAAALLEDAATVRMRIARHDQDRARWQSEVSEARQHLFSSETRIASISEVPAARPAPPPTAASSKSPAAAPNTNSKKAAQTPAPPPANAAPANAAPSNATQPAAPRADNSPVAVGSLVTKAKSRVAPSYPTLARTARVSGNVTVFLIVNEKGEVENVMRAEGPPQLQQAAIEAARRWKFNPTVISGQPVRVSGYLTFNFTL
ncbi:MAG TPA: energy transducer TonB [Pyrinomonadaceae bacterium]